MHTITNILCVSLKDVTYFIPSLRDKSVILDVCTDNDIDAVFNLAHINSTLPSDLIPTPRGRLHLSVNLLYTFATIQ